MPPPLRWRIFFSLVPFESCSQVIFSGELCLIFYSWCSMLGQRTNALHTGCDSSHSNPPYTLAQLTTHNSRAVCTCVTVPLDAHMWAEPTNSMRLPRGAFEGLRRICACSEPRAEGRNGIFRCHSRCARIVVHVFVRSVRLARGSKAHQGHRASSHVYVRCTKQCLVMPHMDSFDWTGVSNQLLKREFSSRSQSSRPGNWDASEKWGGRR